jgi:DNA polymerase I
MQLKTKKMKINPKTKEAYWLLHNGALALQRAHQQGIRVDLNYINEKKIHLTRKINRLENQFKETGFYKEWESATKGKLNINSDKQLRNFLYNVKKIKPPKFTVSGEGSTDGEALAQLNIPELNILAEKAKIERLRDTNLDGYAREQVDGYLHPFFNLHLARTYRSSADSPNLQNVPIRDEESMQICRRALYPRPGHQLLEIDFKGIEVAVNACYNKDPALIKYVKDPKLDMHRDMAKQIFMLDAFDKKIPEHKVLRDTAKGAFVFAQFYGDYYKNCAVNMASNWCKLPQTRWKAGQGILFEGGTISDHLISKGIKSFDAFTDHLKTIEDDFWGVRFAEYANWKERWWKTYRRYGYISTLTGFTCSGVMGKNDVTNYPAQGSAFHCLLWCFTELTNISIRDKWDSRLIGQIHDSMLWDVNNDELELVIKTAQRVTNIDLLDHWKWIIVPMNVEMELSPVDHPWADKKEYKLS